MKRRMLIPVVLAVLGLLAPSLGATEPSPGNPERLYKPGQATGTVGGCSEKFTVNLADAKPAPTVMPALTRHSETMCKMIIEVVPGTVYQALGYGLANMTMVVGEGGVFVIDTLGTVEATAEAYADLRAATGTTAPLAGVLLSHSHDDHFAGIGALLSRADAKTKKVELIAQKGFLYNATGQQTFVDPVGGVRAAFARGVPLIPVGPEGFVNAGLGPLRHPGTRSFVLPNKVVPDEGREELSIAGIKMLLQHIPGNTDDNVVAWFPDLKVLHHGGLVQGESFPALRSPGGIQYRDPVTWYRNIDRVRFQAAEATALIGTHGRPVLGTDALGDVLTAYRDALQFVHDQTIRHINQGHTPEEIVDLVTLPPHLSEHPWLGEFHGTVGAAVREIYAAALGSWHGDAAAFGRLDHRARAQGYVRMMGGREAILAEARAAIERGEPGWAADLLTWPIRVDAGDMEARKLKAAALRQVAYRQTSADRRNIALVSALELENTLPREGGDGGSGSEGERAVWELRGSEARGYQPIARRLMTMATLLKAEQTQDVELMMGLRVEGAWKAHALEIRRGVAEFHPGMPENVDFTLTMKTGAPLDRILSGQSTLAQELASEDNKLEGDRATAERFFGYFDVVDPAAIRLSLH